MISLKHSISFLSLLSVNNNREWFQAHRSDYEASLKEVTAFADQLLMAMNTHDVIETPSGKKSLYRIYRDVRFGKDKSPYKDNWAGHFRRAGASRRGGYYYQIGPEEAFVMGGFFGPNPQDLLHLRKQISGDPAPLREVIESDEFKGFFGELRGEQLKKAPKGFEADHPEIDLLRYKQFLVKHNFTKEEILSADFHLIVSQAFQKMRPFFDAMTGYLTTDLNGESLV